MILIGFLQDYHNLNLVHLLNLEKINVQTSLSSFTKLQKIMDEPIPNVRKYPDYVCIALLSIES
jgi:hypothetical protein